MRKRWFLQLLRRRVFVILLLVVQGLVLIGLICNAGRLAQWVSSAFKVLSILAGLRVVSSGDKPAFKLLWVVLFLLFPVFGGLFYLLVTFQSSTLRVARRLRNLEAASRPFLFTGGGDYEAACQAAPECSPQISYLQRAGFPVCRHTSCRYFPSGEQVFQALLPELRKAERYIFLEFFIIQEGVMWNAVHDILREKAAQGVTVRVLYDDIGSFLTLPKGYADRLCREGIQCRVFNRFRPVLSSLQNNRDHRKIISIDGKVAFTGGFNLADEYINAVEKHGHWKDAGILLQGDAARSLTVMFLQMWNLGSRAPEDFTPFMPGPAPQDTPSDGLVQPYADSPVDRENVGEHVYLQIISRARRYVYIYTPYLIVDDSMLSALSLAAKSGVDVRIITPHHWDKWIIHTATRAYYRPLLDAGVKIYEYTPGFLHAKVFLSDDTTATVGSINLDYRSLYLHFECGVWLYQGQAIRQIKEDFQQTLGVCQEATAADCRHGPLFRLFQGLLRLLAPLL